MNQEPRYEPEEPEVEAGEAAGPAGEVEESDKVREHYRTQFKSSHFTWLSFSIILTPFVQNYSHLSRKKTILGRIMINISRLYINILQKRLAVYVYVLSTYICET